MDHDQLNNGIINLEQWLERNEVYELKHSEHAYSLKKRAMDRKLTAKGVELAQYLLNQAEIDKLIG